MPNTILKVTVRDPLGEVPDLVIDKFAGYERSPVAKFTSPRFAASGNAILDGARHLSTRYTWSISANLELEDALILEDFVELQNERIAAYYGEVANSAARLALGAVAVGQWVIQLDNNTAYRLTATPASTSGNWTALSTPITGLLLLDEYQALSSQVLAQKTAVSGSSVTVGGRTIGFGQFRCFLALADSNPRSLIGAGTVDYSSGDLWQLTQFSAVEIPGLW